MATSRVVKIGLCGFTIAMGKYSSHFPVVEVQQTFYQPPAETVMRRWRASTDPGLTGETYVMFNNIPRAEDALRFGRLLGDG